MASTATSHISAFSQCETARVGTDSARAARGFKQRRGLLQDQKPGHEEEQHQQIEVADRQEPRELEEQRDGKKEGEVEPRRRVRQTKIEENRGFHGCAPTVAIRLRVCSRPTGREAAEA